MTPPSPWFTYGIALFATALFSGSSIAFGVYSTRHSPMWMNMLKMWVGLACFWISTAMLVAFGIEPIREMTSESVWLLLTSGVLGIVLADWCLLQAFTRLGPARTMLIYNFHPIFISVAGYFLFAQQLTSNQALAIVFLMLCVFVISLERYRDKGRWDFKFVCLALVAVSLDAGGVLMTRRAFDLYPNGTAFGISSVRFAGAALFAAVVFGRRAFPFLNRSTPALRRDLKTASAFSVTGAFICLALWVTALKFGHIGTLSALSGFNPVAVTLIESIYTRKWPTRYLWVSLGLFACGFALLMT